MVHDIIYISSTFLFAISAYIQLFLGCAHEGWILMGSRQSFSSVILSLQQVDNTISVDSFPYSSSVITIAFLRAS